MSHRGKYFTPRLANTTFHFIRVEKEAEVLFAFKLEAVLGSRDHPGAGRVRAKGRESQHTSVSSPARGPCRGNCSGWSFQRSTDTTV